MGFLTWSLKVSTMSTTLTVWSSTPSSSSPPSAEGFAPMFTSTAPWTTHCQITKHIPKLDYLIALHTFFCTIATKQNITIAKVQALNPLRSTDTNMTPTIWTTKLIELTNKKSSNLSFNFPQNSILNFLVRERIREKLVTWNFINEDQFAAPTLCYFKNNFPPTI